MRYYLDIHLGIHDIMICVDKNVTVLFLTQPTFSASAKTATVSSHTRRSPCNNIYNFVTVPTQLHNSHLNLIRST